MRNCCVLFMITMAAIAMVCGCSQSRRVPVILDTDIGHDIDDTWALAFLLACPQLDLKLVVTDSHDTEAKAKIAAKFLERVGRTDVPVGVGIKINAEAGPQGPWAEDYDLANYPGKIHRDGVQALIDTIMHSARPVTLIAIGPVPNLAEALQREPRIAKRARLVVMGGSIEKQYQDRPGRCAEYNVKRHPQAAQISYTAGWDVTMAPLDTAGVVQLSGLEYMRVHDADNPLAKALMENYRLWITNTNMDSCYDADKVSSILFDTVAIYLVFDRKFCRMRDLRIRVTDQGVTEPDPQGKLVHAAMDWQDLEAFCYLLADRIAGFKPKQNSSRDQE